jgi:glutamate dehydrogenase
LLTRCRDAAQRLASQWPALLPTADLEALMERQRILVDAGVDSELAVRVASGEISAALLDIAEVAATCGKNLELVAGVYFALGTQLNYGWIAERANALPAPTHWDMLARAAALAELARLKRALTTSALAGATESSTPDELVERWQAQRAAPLERYARLVADLRASGGSSLSVLLVIVREMALLERT